MVKEFIARMEVGKFRRKKDAQAWIKKRTRRAISVSGTRKVSRRLVGKLKVLRESHAKKDPIKATKFYSALPLGRFGRCQRGG